MASPTTLAEANCRKLRRFKILLVVINSPVKAVVKTSEVCRKIIAQGLCSDCIQSTLIQIKLGQIISIAAQAGYAFLGIAYLHNIPAMPKQSQNLQINREQAFSALRPRIAPICKRTLHQQVQQYVSYTARGAIESPARSCFLTSSPACCIRWCESCCANRSLSAYCPSHQNHRSLICAATKKAAQLQPPFPYLMTTFSETPRPSRHVCAKHGYCHCCPPCQCLRR